MLFIKLVKLAYMKLHIAPRIYARRLLRLLFDYCSLIGRRHVPRACLSLALEASGGLCDCTPIRAAQISRCLFPTPPSSALRSLRLRPQLLVLSVVAPSSSSSAPPLSVVAPSLASPDPIPRRPFSDRHRSCVLRWQRRMCSPCAHPHRVHQRRRRVYRRQRRIHRRGAISRQVRPCGVVHAASLFRQSNTDDGEIKLSPTERRGGQGDRYVMALISIPLSQL